MFLNSNYKWAVIENIITIIAVIVLFIITRSGWVFLLLINLNSIKIKS